MAVGFISAKLKVIDKILIKGLSNLLINVSLPCLIITTFNFSFTKEMLHNSIIVIIITFAIHLFAIILSRILFYKYNKKDQQVLSFIVIFSNCAFMGFPIVSSVYGKEGLFYTSIYNIVFTLMVWTYGAYLFSEKKDKSGLFKILINPSIIATFIGIFTFMFSIKLPSPVQGTLSMIGNMTTPLSMLVIGASLINIRFSDIATSFKIYFVSLIRLLIVPIVLILALKFINLPYIIKGTIVLLTAMPAAAITAIFAEAGDGDVELSSKIILISTILSAFTIPLIILLL
jgi:predicted permease